MCECDFKHYPTEVLRKNKNVTNGTLCKELEHSKRKNKNYNSNTYLESQKYRYNLYVQMKSFFICNPNPFISKALNSEQLQKYWACSRFI